MHPFVDPPSAATAVNAVQPLKGEVASQTAVEIKVDAMVALEVRELVADGVRVPSVVGPGTSVLLPVLLPAVLLLRLPLLFVPLPVVPLPRVPLPRMLLLHVPLHRVRLPLVLLPFVPLPRSWPLFVPPPRVPLPRAPPPPRVLFVQPPHWLASHGLAWPPLTLLLPPPLALLPDVLLRYALSVPFVSSLPYASPLRLQHAPPLPPDAAVRWRAALMCPQSLAAVGVLISPSQAAHLPLQPDGSAAELECSAAQWVQV